MGLIKRIYPVGTLKKAMVKFLGEFCKLFHDDLLFVNDRAQLFAKFSAYEAKKGELFDLWEYKKGKAWEWDPKVPIKFFYFTDIVVDHFYASKKEFGKLIVKHQEQHTWVGKKSSLATE